MQTKDKLFSCVHCKNSFKTTKDLKTHMLQYHGGKMSHNCNQCGFSSSNAANLKIHMIYHTCSDRLRVWAQICLAWWIKRCSSSQFASRSSLLRESRHPKCGKVPWVENFRFLGQKNKKLPEVLEWSNSSRKLIKKVSFFLTWSIFFQIKMPVTFEPGLKRLKFETGYFILLLHGGHFG